MPGAPVAILALAVAAVALALLARLRLVETSDVSWILYGSERMVEGARLGVDVVENTPPMIFWLTTPTVALARALGVDAWPAWVWTIAALALASSAVSAQLVTRLPALRDRASGMLALAVLLVATLVVPGFDFGQREQLTLLLTLPYVTLAGLRLASNEERAVPSRATVVAIGVAAGLGIGIKPHFALLPIALAAAQATSAGVATTLRRPEHLMVVLTGLLYLLAVAVATPEWLAYARAFGPHYASLRSYSAWTIALRGNGAAESIMALLAWGLLARRATAIRPLTLAVGLAAACFYVVAVLQLKGWRYHFLPAISYGFILLCMLLAWLVATRRGFVRAFSVAAAVAAVLAMPLWALRLDTDVLRGRRPRPDLDEFIPGTLAALEGRRSIAVLSSNIASSFPLLRMAGTRSVLRHPLLWPLRLDELTRVEPDGVRRCPPIAERTALAHRFLGEVAEDLRRGEPDVLLLMTPDARDGRWEGARRIDYMECLRRDPALRPLLDRYRRYAVVGPYELLERR
ncbi:MAG TPA: hypothetical protein VFX50_14660 [Gemmatimonadales bacterium]|nr:hypothetical protein [Gemmatimonadales bacterium]